MRRKIKDITEIIIGYQHRGKPISMGSVGTHKVIQIKDLDKEERFISYFAVPAEHRLSMGSLYRVTPKGKPEAYAVQDDDVLFLSRGARYLAVPLVRGYVWPYPESWEGIIATYYFYILRPIGDNVLPEYLAWVLNGERARADMEAVSQGSHMKMISKSDFGLLSIDLPPLELQRNVVELYQLGLREQRLIGQIQQKRTAMIDSLCNRAAADNS